jgi:two-component system, cell cycle sensor histidine kinase and response regulator CckA
VALVSRRTIDFVHHVCDRHAISYAELCIGIVGLVPGADGRIEWDAVAELLDRIEQRVGGPAALELEGERSNQVAALEPLRRIAGAFASPRLVYRAIVRWFGPQLVPWIGASYEDLPDGRIRVVMEIPEPLRQCAAFLHYTAGAYRSAPRLLGQPDALVEAEITPRRGVYSILPPPDLTLAARARSAIRVFGGSRVALDELVRQQDQLRRSHAALADSRADLERIVEHLPVGVLVLRGDAVLYANEAWHAWLGGKDTSVRTRAELVELADPTKRSRLADWLGAKDGREQAPPDADQVADRRSDVLELRLTPPNGRAVSVELSRPQPIMFGSGSALLVAVRNTTHARSLEAQLHEAQRLEAIGRLAGGIAHDFNNLLSAIFGFARLLGDDLPEDSPGQEDVSEILLAAERAATLTRQLLALGRKQILEPRVLNVNVRLREMEKLLARVIGENVDLVFALDPSVKNIKVDPTQLEQVVMNLVLNARDAMPRGGRVTVETASVELDARAPKRHGEAPAGPHVLIAVSDDGEGIAPELQDRVFEPFFTTKAAGRGSGLGLSSVLGIVKQSGGHIWLYSEPGQGTTFKVFFPVTQEAAVVRGPISEAPRQGGKETILLVEDDHGVRRFVRTALERNGYVVLAAASPAEARELAAQARAIDLMLSDVVMPTTSGPELADELKVARPELRVLFTSGYAEHAIVHQGVLREGVEFLPKPLALETLLTRVRAVLDLTRDR